MVIGNRILIAAWVSGAKRLLAFALAAAVVLSVFHEGFVCDQVPQVGVVVTMNGGAPAPHSHGAVQGDHCLCHMAAEIAAPAVWTPAVMTAARLPSESADGQPIGLSARPFEPPRAPAA